MPAPYSLDLRERVRACAEEEQLTHGALARRFRVGESTVRHWLRRARETGSVAATPAAGGPKPEIAGEGAAVLEALVTEANGATLAELAARYAARRGTRVLDQSTVCRACQRLDLRWKKRSATPAEQTREDVAAARQAWRTEVGPTLRPDDLVFVDETGVATDLARRYGRAKGGRRAPSAVPYGSWHRLTILGGLSLAGLVACMAVNSATDTDVMVAFTRQVLVPVLRPGQVVIMDNLSPHKAPAVRRLIERAGYRLLFLPPYSPDLNPIEPAWSKLKALLRGVGARTVAALHAALERLVDAITADDAHGFFRHCGYAR